MASNSVTVPGRSSALEELRNPRERIFVDEYCTGRRTGKRFNQTHAAIAAGFSSTWALQSASRLKRIPRVREAIEKRMAEVTMGPREVVARVAAIADAPIGDFVVVDEYGVFRVNKDAWPKVAPFLTEFGYDSNGLPKFKFMDSQAALRDLLKVYGLTREGLDLGSLAAGGVPVSLTVNFVDNSGVPKEVPKDDVQDAEWEEIP